MTSTKQDGNKKYKFTGAIKYKFGRTLHQIISLRDFGNVKKGEIGGWIEKESNLSHQGKCWVSENGHVSGNGRVSENGHVSGNGRVSEKGWVFGNGWVYGSTHICGDVCLKEVICSRFTFKTDKQVKLWLQKEKEFEDAQ